jgi:hypothetical protein
MGYYGARRLHSGRAVTVSTRGALLGPVLGPPGAGFGG